MLLAPTVPTTPSRSSTAHRLPPLRMYSIANAVTSGSTSVASTALPCHIRSAKKFPKEAPDPPDMSRYRTAADRARGAYGTRATEISRVSARTASTVRTGVATTYVRVPAGSPLSQPTLPMSASMLCTGGLCEPRAGNCWSLSIVSLSGKVPRSATHSARFTK